MDEQKTIPTLYEWAGGMPVFIKLFDRFYDKVLTDDLLEPVFKHMSPRHRLHVAHFVAEVLGGPKLYSESDGSHFEMIKHHLSKHLTQQHRQRWMELLLQTADELELPDDPEFRSAFLALIRRHFSDMLIPQDRQGFRPHITVMNKSTPEQAKSLITDLMINFQPFNIEITGMDLWTYLRGPWEHLQHFNFSLPA